MLKTISLAIISSFLLISNAHAIYEDKLLDLIREHVVLTRTPKPVEPEKGLLDCVTSLPGKLAEVSGESVRAIGNTLRRGDGLGNYVGNGFRTLGAYGSPEILTLERKLRKFWVGAKINQVGIKEIFTSTACALCESTEFTENLSAEAGVEKIWKAYQDFVISWNQSSKTINFRAEDEEFHMECKLNAVIRKRASENKLQGRPWGTPQDVLNTTSLYKIDLTKHPKTKGIREENTIPNGAAKMDYEARFVILHNKRLEVLLEDIQIKYKFERSMLGFKDE